MIVSTRRGLGLPPSAFSRRTLLLTFILLPSVLMWLHSLVLPALRRNFPGQLAPGKTSNGQPIDLAAYPYSQESNITVNLVLATIASDDISWTSRLQIPNLSIIRYVGDDQTAPYHPPAPKGREALMYHTYFHDHYDNLADISILIHAHETPWHADPQLWSSMPFVLSRLDLREVARRGYANLRAGWEHACPDWINTTLSPEESVKQEEPFAGAAFRANFGDGAPVPEILAGPCCSQFAVTREAVRRRPRDQYARSARWLVDTDWSDYIVGRTWEHMWPWLFKGEATDCPVAWKTYCRMYGVCFAGPDEVQEIDDLWAEKKALLDERGFFREIWDPEKAMRGRNRIREIEERMALSLTAAMSRGEDVNIRGSALGDLYTM